MLKLRPIVISLFSYPIKEKVKTSPDLIFFNWNFPSKSVEVPFVVPFTTTFTPGKLSPAAKSLTTPVNVCCANIDKEDSIRIPMSNNLVFFMYNLLYNNCKLDV